MIKKKSKTMTMEDVKRIKRAYAKKHGGKIPKGSFPARIESIVALREAKECN